jgi:hypothetical protein
LRRRTLVQSSLKLLLLVNILSHLVIVLSCIVHAHYSVVWCDLLSQKSSVLTDMPDFNRTPKPCTIFTEVIARCRTSQTLTEHFHRTSEVSLEYEEAQLNDLNASKLYI